MEQIKITTFLIFGKNITKSKSHTLWSDTATWENEIIEFGLVVFSKHQSQKVYISTCWLFESNI